MTKEENRNDLIYETAVKALETLKKESNKVIDIVWVAAYLMATAQINFNSASLPNFSMERFEEMVNYLKNEAITDFNQEGFSLN